MPNFDYCPLSAVRGKWRLLMAGPTLHGRDLKRGATTGTDELHFTGGLRGIRNGDGWIIVPVIRGGNIQGLGPVQDADIQKVTRQIGCVTFGADEINFLDPNLPARMWRPFIGQTSSQHLPADRWGAISFAAREDGNASYADNARNVDISLRAAGIRLRDASDQYHRQLKAALMRKQPSNLRFTNMALKDLHLAFHSLLSEMASARDYLAQVSAHHIGAPTEQDSLARLISWSKPSDKKHHRNETIFAALLNSYQEASADRWLFDLTQYRNMFLHRRPLGAPGISSFLSIIEKESPYGTVLQATMRIPVDPNEAGDKNGFPDIDGLERFVDLYRRLLLLADFAADHALYPSDPPNVVFT